MPFLAVLQGISIYLNRQKLPRGSLAILAGDLGLTFGGFSTTTDLFLGSRQDLHPGRFFTGSLAFVEIFGESLNFFQIRCIYDGFWSVLVENSCYWKEPDITAADEGKVNADGSQSFCGPAVPGRQLWHSFGELVSGVGYSVAVHAVNGVGSSAVTSLDFVARTAEIKAIPPMIERSVMKPNMLTAEYLLLNLGDGQMTWAITAVRTNISVRMFPHSGIVGASAVGLLTCDVNSTGLAPGQHTVDVTVATNAAERPGTTNIHLVMSVESHATAANSMAEGPTLAKITRGSKGNKVFVFAFDADGEVAVAGDQFTLTVTPVATAGPGRRLQDIMGLQTDPAQPAPARRLQDIMAAPGMIRAHIMSFGAGVYRAEYDAPEQPGFYLTSVMLSGQHVGGSPYQTQSVCAFGEYNDEDASDCKTCDPSMVRCDREGVILRDLPHKSGFWRSSTASPHFHPCTNQQCTAGVGPTCNAGFTGVLCRTCDASHAVTVQDCMSCPSVGVLVLMLVMATAAPFLSIYQWVRWHMRTRHIFKSQSAVIFKIMFNFIQTCSMMAFYQTHFAPLLENLLGIEMALSSFFVLSRFGLGCLADMPPASTFVAQVYVVLGWPTMCAAALGAAIGMNIYLQQMDKANSRLMFLFLVLYIAFPAVVKIALQSFVCAEVRPH